MSLIYHAQASGGSGSTTASADTTGVKFFVVIATYWQGGLLDPLTDNMSNTLTVLGGADYGDVTTEVKVRVCYVLAPTVGSGHQFFASPTSGHPTGTTLIVLGFDDDVSSLDTSGSNSTTGTTGQPGSLTPAQAESLVINAVGTANSSGETPYSIDSGYTMDESIGYGSGHFGSAAAYKRLSSIAAQNPTWTLGASRTLVMAQAVFNVDTSITVAPSADEMKLASVAPTVVLGSTTATPSARTFKLASVAPSIIAGPITMTPDFARFVVAASPGVISESLGSVAVTPERAIVRFETSVSVVSGLLIVPTERAFVLTATGPTIALGALTIAPSPSAFRLSSRGRPYKQVFPHNFGTARDNVATFQSVTWPVEQSIDMLNIIQDYGDGFERRVNLNEAYSRADGEASVSEYAGRNSFRLRLICMDFAAAAAVLWSFYKQMTGALDSFYFYNVPDEIAGADPTGQETQGRYLVRFADNTLTREKFALLLYRAELTLLEVRE